MISGTLNGNPLSVEKGTTILEAAIDAGVHIPTLCHHEGLPEEGNCRLCTVEIREGKRKRLVASCMYPLHREGFEIFTDSEEVREARKLVIWLLIQRNPKAPILLDLAREYGVVPEVIFAPEETDLCIRCGRCIRACNENGTGAIGFAFRGWERKVSAPLEEKPADCIGCLSCASVCPTGKITYEETKDTRTIWDRTFTLLRCSACGEPFATPEQIAWLKLEGTADGTLCPRCRRKREAASFPL